ncbi:MAG: CBS domain-containing protein [Betaproteobacteria bacterium]|nr:CBS domain-containing protein [Betaproteobacteria bacterium]
MPTPAPLVDSTCDFLRRHPPFDRMGEACLRGLVPRLKLAYFARDSQLLSPQSGPVQTLYIVQRGVIGCRPDSPQADPEPALGPGELFPVGALSAGGATTKVFTAAQDSFCYLLAREDFLNLRRESPEFERFCTDAITETLKQSLASLYSQYSQRAADQQSLTCTLDELVRHPPVACPADAPLRDALQRMADARVRTLVVEAADGAPVGMFTLVDLLRRVALPGRSLATPLAEVMTTPIVALPATATAYEAMHVMAERAIRQIAVVDGGRLKGVVNERDLFALQRVSMRQVIEGLHGARSVDELKRAGEDIRRLTLNLLAQGVGAEPLTRTIASLNDALSRRLLELVQERHDLADCDWCWLALGSEGRGEQTFATDQDNALIFTAADDDERERHRERLLAFARDVNAALDQLGFPLCTGNVMASNPELCLSVEEWRGKFLGWVRTPTPEALLAANIVFDFRPLHGNTVLADALREWLFDYTRDNRVFLRFMVENALQVEPPLGLIRTFATDDDPAHKGSFDLKARGTRLFVDAARVFALGRGIADTGTAARLRLAGRALGVEARHVDATIDGFHFLQLLRLRQQDSPGGMASANRIDPYALNEVEQRMLKESFRQAKKLQQLTRQVYLA